MAVGSATRAALQLYFHIQANGVLVNVGDEVRGAGDCAVSTRAGRPDRTSLPGAG